MQVSNAQHQAITHGAGPAIVLAGPGSGKTLVITQRVRYLIEAYHVRPQEILVITFTKAAAQEMQSRFQALSRQRGVTFGTFHAVFFHILKYAYHYSAANILTEEKKYQILQRLLLQRPSRLLNERGRNKLRPICFQLFAAGREIRGHGSALRFAGGASRINGIRIR